ncbi:MAG TPA: hypothetical protein VJ748_00755, partial [Vitreimonas sp.]|nr:hypothetical protein [Vitreimonas sp.]
MQYFINHAAIERASGEVFAGPRAQLYLFGLIALLAAAAAGLAPAAIWLGLALLVDEARNAFAKRLGAFSAAQAKAALLALDIASAASLAAAPAIAWYAGGVLSAGLAAIMLCVLVAHAAFSGRHGRLHTFATCAPYALLGAMFLFDAGGAFVAVAACALGVGYVFALAMHHAHAAAHARVQDAEWVRQLNMSFGDADSAAWEIDFTRGRLIGAQRLGALFGRPVSYRDVVEGCFASTEDRALVKAAFAPEGGGFRRIALEHDAVRADGARIRVRHQGFVRTTAAGAPVRLTCVTRHSETVAVPAYAPAALQRDIVVALGTQRETLKKLRNELAMTL